MDVNLTFVVTMKMLTAAKKQYLYQLHPASRYIMSGTPLRFGSDYYLFQLF